jgi:hypothetical protein
MVAIKKIFRPAETRGNALPDLGNEVINHAFMTRRKNRVKAFFRSRSETPNPTQQNLDSSAIGFIIKKNGCNSFATFTQPK